MRTRGTPFRAKRLGSLVACGARFCRLAMYRLSRALAACVLSVAVAGCNTGIGPDLYSPDMAQATRNLEAYLGYLCEQADISLAPQCPDGMGRSGWSLVVATGMNDIDRRCDEYLAWIDAQRVRRQFVGTEFGHIRTLVSGIFGIVGTAPGTVAIVGLALGFAQDTYNAFYNRIVFEIEGSTVETIVIGRRLDFREQFADGGVSFKPDAVKVLRDYLRICTPYAIKMSVNTYSRSRVTGEVPIQEQETRRLRESLLTAEIKDATVPIPPPPPPPVTVLPTRFGSFEESLLPRDIEDFQRAACVPPTGDLGPMGSETRLAIKRVLGADDEILTDRKGVLLRRRLRAGVEC
jgi:hypothetical protein